MTAETFFAELKKIIQSQPLPPLRILQSEDCKFADNIYACKNITYGFDTVRCTDSAYIYDGFICDNCIDCDYPVESQLCYESIDPYKAFNCDYVNYCANIRDSAFCDTCWNANDLFGCYNLQNKQFCIFNRQLSETEYREKVKEYKKWPPEKILAIVEELKLRYPLTQTISGHNENTTYGNYIHYNKNCYLCFDAAHDENGAYLYDTFDCKNCFDSTYGKDNQLTYEVVSSPNLFNCNYTYYSGSCIDSSYLVNCLDVKDSLGCVNLAHKQYCILNRQLTKEEYERMSKPLLEDLKKKNLGWNDIGF